MVTGDERPVIREGESTSLMEALYNLRSQPINDRLLGDPQHWNVEAWDQHQATLDATKIIANRIIEKIEKLPVHLVNGVGHIPARQVLDLLGRSKRIEL